MAIAIIKEEKIIGFYANPNTIEKVIEKEIAKKEDDIWEQVDVFQYIRNINENEIEIWDINKNNQGKHTLFNQIINIKDYTEEELTKIVEKFGYDLEYINKSTERKQIIAECIAESSNQREAIDIKEIKLYN